MAIMQSGKRRARWGRRLPRILSAAILAWVSFSRPSAAQQWDPEAAETALKQARELRKRFSADQPAGTDDYVRCIRLYRRVYLSDPHFPGSDDAIYEAAALYQEMAARFNAPEYDREAAQLLRFLLKDYPTSQFRPYAVLRLAAMGPARAGPPTGVPGIPARPQARGKDVQSESRAGPGPAQSPAAQGTARAAAVRGIHYRSAAEYTRVTIDLDERASYQEQRISNPDRVFFDFSNTWLVLDSNDQAIAVNDQFLRKVRAAQHRPGVVRIVLDLGQGADCAVSEMSDPFRIIIDIRRGQSPVSPRN